MDHSSSSNSKEGGARRDGKLRTWQTYQHALHDTVKGLSAAIKTQQDAFFLQQARFDVEAEANRAEFEERQRRRKRPGPPEPEHAAGTAASTSPAFSPIANGPTDTFRRVVQAQLAQEEELQFQAEESKARAEFLAEMANRFPLAFLSSEAQFTLEHELHAMLQRNLLRVTVARKELVDSGVPDTADSVLSQVLNHAADGEHAAVANACAPPRGGGRWEQCGPFASLVKHEEEDAEMAASSRVKSEHLGGAVAEEGVRTRDDSMSGNAGTASPVSRVDSLGGSSRVTTSMEEEDKLALLPYFPSRSAHSAAKTETNGPEDEEAGTVVRVHPDNQRQARLLARCLEGRGVLLSPVPQCRGSVDAAGSTAPLYTSPSLTATAVTTSTADSITEADTAVAEEEERGERGRRASASERLRRLQTPYQPLLNAFLDCAMEAEADRCERACARAEAAVTREREAEARAVVVGPADSNGHLPGPSGSSFGDDILLLANGEGDAEESVLRRRERLESALAQAQRQRQDFLSNYDEQHQKHMTTTIPLLLHDAVVRDGGSLSSSVVAETDTGQAHAREERVRVPVASATPPKLSASDVGHIFSSLTATPTLAGIAFFSAQPLSPPEAQRISRLRKAKTRRERRSRRAASAASSDESGATTDISESSGDEGAHGGERPLRLHEELLKLPEESDESERYLARHYMWPEELERGIAHQLSGLTQPPRRRTARAEAGKAGLRSLGTADEAAGGARSRGRYGWLPLMMSAVDLGDVFTLAFTHEMGIRAPSPPQTARATEEDGPEEGEGEGASTTARGTKRQRVAEEGEAERFATRVRNDETNSKDDDDDDDADGRVVPVGDSPATERQIAPSQQLADNVTTAAEQDAINEALAACYRAVCTSISAITQEKKRKVYLPGSQWGYIDKLKTTGITSVFDPNFAYSNANRPGDGVAPSNTGTAAVAAPAPEENNELTVLMKAAMLGSVPTGQPVPSLSTLQLVKRVVDRRFHHVNLPRSCGATLLRIGGAGEFVAAEARMTSTFVAPPMDKELVHKLLEHNYEV